MSHLFWKFIFLCSSVPLSRTTRDFKTILIDSGYTCNHTEASQLFNKPLVLIDSLLHSSPQLTPNNPPVIKTSQSFFPPSVSSVLSRSIYWAYGPVSWFTEKIRLFGDDILQSPFRPEGVAGFICAHPLSQIHFLKQRVFSVLLGLSRLLLGHGSINCS